MDNITFEEAVASLEQIVRSMEEGKLTLEESLAAFEKGVGLVKYCNGKLDSAEQRVKVLLCGPDGELEEKDFTPPQGG